MSLITGGFGSPVFAADGFYAESIPLFSPAIYGAPRQSAPLLELVRRANAELGLPVPGTVVGNLQDSAVNQLALINAVGRELLREYEWQGLCREFRFTTPFIKTQGITRVGSPVVTDIPSTDNFDTTYGVVGEGVPLDTTILTVDGPNQVTLSQPANESRSSYLTLGKVAYFMPADYDRQIDRTHWDRTRRWNMLGPLTAQQWQARKSSFAISSLNICYRILGNSFQIYPPMSALETLAFEYVSNAWVTDADSTAKKLFTKDTDTCMFGDELMVLALKKKYFELKGFDASVYRQDYKAELSRAKADDGGSTTLSMMGRKGSYLLGYYNVPESGYGR